MDATLDLALRVAGLLAQVSIPVVLYLAGRQISRAQYLKSTQDAWNEYNKLVIQNPDNARVARAAFGYGWLAESEDNYRKAHIGFVALNAFLIVHAGTKYKLLPKDYRDANTTQVLSHWLKDEQIFELSQSRGYPEEFRRLCKEVRGRAHAVSAA